MTRLRTILTLGFLLKALTLALQGQTAQEWVIQGLTDQGWAYWNYDRGLITGTNGVMVQFAGAVLTAETVSVDTNSCEVIADGRVRIQRDEQVWASEHVRYNFVTRQIYAEQFRTGKPPVFAAGEGLHADITNQLSVATNAVITTDDVSRPGIQVRAKYIKIIPGDRIEARHATLYIEGVPVFYFPYYSRSLGDRVNQFNFVPGFRSSFGPYILGTYTWFLSPELDGRFHFDYRERRGPGVGPDFNYHLGPWGEGSLRYYYTYDTAPQLGANTNNSPIPNNRQRIDFSYLATPGTNLSVRSVVRYQGDTNVVREFFESEYRENPQPSTFVEINKFWQNFSLDPYFQPRVNNFLDTVERLPEVRLTGFRQELGSTPLYYESQSSAGYYRKLFAQTNSISTGGDYEAGRIDTYHQVLLPETFFGWLNVTPRWGGRFTYYTESSGPGGQWGEESRGVFNTGAEVTFKASRVWSGLQNSLLAMDGLRHIVQPSFNYVFVPKPTVQPNELPQFDTQLPSLELLPNEFPSFNAIDDIDAQSAIRLGLNNKLQTKREGAVVDLLQWQLYTDWRLRTRQELTNLTRFSDVYSDLVFRPRSWITVESKTRYDVTDGLWRMSLHTLTLQPNDVWSWSLGHFYLRDDVTNSATALGEGNNLIMSTIFYRLNEDWGFRASHYFEARTGIMQEQAYTVYRDLRSWTTALTFRLRENPTGPDDLSVAITFSLKAFPRMGLGRDARMPYSLWGG
jgi:LPS-assembly protein